MMIQTKSGVWLGEINNYFMSFLEALREVGNRRGFIPFITSGCEGKHMEGSKHYKHKAWDLRIWNMRDPHAATDDLRNTLNRDGEKWIVLYGDEYHKDHAHVQTDGDW